MAARAALAALLACALAGCKDKQEAQPAPAPSKPGTQPLVRDRPSLPGEPTRPPPPAPGDTNHPALPRPSKPLEIADAEAALPKIEGKQIIALKQTADHGQVHGTWCIDGTSAEDVAQKVGEWLAEAGYTNISTRGEARKAGVAGERDGIRFSMVVSASTAQVCAAPAHYFASATLFRL